MSWVRAGNVPGAVVLWVVVGMSAPLRARGGPWWVAHGRPCQGGREGAQRPARGPLTGPRASRWDRGLSRHRGLLGALVGPSWQSPSPRAVVRVRCRWVKYGARGPPCPAPKSVISVGPPEGPPGP